MDHVRRVGVRAVRADLCLRFCWDEYRSGARFWNLVHVRVVRLRRDHVHRLDRDGDQESFR